MGEKKKIDKISAAAEIYEKTPEDEIFKKFAKEIDLSKVKLSKLIGDPASVEGLMQFYLENKFDNAYYGAQLERLEDIKSKGLQRIYEIATWDILESRYTRYNGYVEEDIPAQLETVKETILDVVDRMIDEKLRKDLNELEKFRKEYTSLEDTIGSDNPKLSTYKFNEAEEFDKAVKSNYYKYFNFRGKDDKFSKFSEHIEQEEEIATSLNKERTFINLILKQTYENILLKDIFSLVAYGDMSGSIFEYYGTKTEIDQKIKKLKENYGKVVDEQAKHFNEIRANLSQQILNGINNLIAQTNNCSELRSKESDIVWKQVALKDADLDLKFIKKLEQDFIFYKNKLMSNSEFLRISEKVNNSAEVLKVLKAKEQFIRYSLNQIISNIRSYKVINGFRFEDTKSRIDDELNKLYNNYFELSKQNKEEFSFFQNEIKNKAYSLNVHGDYSKLLVKKAKRLIESENKSIEDEIVSSILDEASKRDPMNIEVPLLRAKHYAEIKNDVLASKYVEEVKRIDENNIETSIIQGQISENNKDLDRAYHEYIKAAKLDPKNNKFLLEFIIKDLRFAITHPKFENVSAEIISQIAKNAPVTTLNLFTLNPNFNHKLYEQLMFTWLNEQVKAYDDSTSVEQRDPEILFSCAGGYKLFIDNLTKKGKPIRKDHLELKERISSRLDKLDDLFFNDAAVIESYRLLGEDKPDKAGEKSKYAQLKILEKSIAEALPKHKSDDALRYLLEMMSDEEMKAFEEEKKKEREAEEAVEKALEAANEEESESEDDELDDLELEEEEEKEE